MKSKISLNSFISYCKEHPEERFWQALRNWSVVPFIYKSNKCIEDVDVKDTFYEE